MEVRFFPYNSSSFSFPTFRQFLFWGSRKPSAFEVEFYGSPAILPIHPRVRSNMGVPQIELIKNQPKQKLSTTFDIQSCLEVLHSSHYLRKVCIQFWAQGAWEFWRALTLRHHFAVWRRRKTMIQRKKCRPRDEAMISWMISIPMHLHAFTVVAIQTTHWRNRTYLL